MTENVASLQDLSWQAYMEITLPCLPGEEGLANAGAAAIAERIRSLNLPAARLERLNTALVEASGNIIKRAARQEPLLPLCIRVFVSGKIPAPAERLSVDLPGTRERDQYPLQAHASRDWGFFLVEKTVDPAGLGQADAHHAIDLFLYFEGDQAG